MNSATFLTPCFNDFNCAIRLIHEISLLENNNTSSCKEIIIVNDAPWDLIPRQEIEQLARKAKLSVTILNLLSNLGHQRALAVGLAWLQSRSAHHGFVVILDSDGEDNPQEVPRMFQALDASKALACVAVRGERKEGLRFRLGYGLYQWLVLYLSGQRLNYGNFMLLHPSALKVLAGSPDTAVHVAASLLRSRLPLTRIISDRRRRYQGTSKMGGYANLVVHAFRAFSVIGDQIAVRLLGLNISLLFISFSLAMLALILRFSGWFPFTASPGWTTLVLLMVFGFLVVASLVIFSLALSLITARSSALMSPAQLMQCYLDEVVTISFSHDHIGSNGASLKE